MALQRDKGGQYKLQQLVADHPSTGSSITAKIAIGKLTIYWIQNELKNQGVADWRVDASNDKAEAEHTILTLSGKGDRTCRCTVTRNSADPKGAFKK